MAALAYRRSLDSMLQNKVSVRWSGKDFFGNMRRALYERAVYFWRIFFILNFCAIFKFCGKLTKFISTKYTIHCCLYLNFFVIRSMSEPNQKSRITSGENAAVVPESDVKALIQKYEMETSSEFIVYHSDKSFGSNGKLKLILN